MLAAVLLMSIGIDLLELDGTYAEPGNDVRVGRVTGATGKLLLTGGSDHDGVLHGSLAAGIKRTHVEDVNALHLSENFQTFQTGSLLEIGRDGTGLGTRTEKILVRLDLCIDIEYVS